MQFIIDKKKGKFLIPSYSNDPTPVTPVPPMPGPDQKSESDSNKLPPGTKSESDWLLYAGIAVLALVLIIKVFSKA